MLPLISGVYQFPDGVVNFRFSTYSDNKSSCRAQGERKCSGSLWRNRPGDERRTLGREPAEAAEPTQGEFGRSSEVELSSGEID